jgi:hypothetical protein
MSSPKQRYLTPSERFRRGLLQLVSLALAAGYAVGWCWRGRVDRRRFWSSRASSRKSGG